MTGFTYEGPFAQRDRPGAAQLISPTERIIPMNGGMWWVAEKIYEGAWRRMNNCFTREHAIASLMINRLGGEA